MHYCMCLLSQSSKPGLDLLSDTPSEEDGLFTTKPASKAKASVPPPTSTKVKQAAPIDEDLTLEAMDCLQPNQYQQLNSLRQQPHLL